MGLSRDFIEEYSLKHPLSVTERIAMEALLKKFLDFMNIVETPYRPTPPSKDYKEYGEFVCTNVRCDKCGFEYPAFLFSNSGKYECPNCGAFSTATLIPF